MSKKQSTLFAGGAVLAEPADIDFVVDGEFAGILFTIFSLTGTDISGAVTELFEDGFDFSYDAQTANYTIGAILTGKESGAKALIVGDTDGGADGVLILKKLTGHFKDGEIIVDDDGTPGSSTADGLPVRRFAEGADWVTIVAQTGAGESNFQFLNPLLAADAGDRGRVLPRRFRLKQTWNTVTTADYAVDLIQSGV